MVQRKSRHKYSMFGQLRAALQTRQVAHTKAHTKITCDSLGDLGGLHADKYTSHLIQWSAWFKPEIQRLIPYLLSFPKDPVLPK